MKVLMLLGLVGAAVFLRGLSPKFRSFSARSSRNCGSPGRSLGNPSDRQLSSWGTHLFLLSTLEFSGGVASPLPKPAVTAASTSPPAGSEEEPTTARPGLVLADRSTVTQTAMATPVRKVAGEAANANPAPIAKKPVRTSRPAARMPDKFAVAQFDRRWERRATRRGGLFFFGRRFARAE